MCDATSLLSDAALPTKNLRQRSTAKAPLNVLGKFDPTEAHRLYHQNPQSDWEIPTDRSIHGLCPSSFLTSSSTRFKYVIKAGDAAIR
jgi:hypothetical protein